MTKEFPLGVALQLSVLTFDVQYSSARRKRNISRCGIFNQNTAQVIHKASNARR
jgi:hypothetical protein